jgi:Holliday junction resolvase
VSQDSRDVAERLGAKRASRLCSLTAAHHEEQTTLHPVPDNPDPDFERTARRLAEVLARLGNNASPTRIAERVKQLERGLPAEDHFMLLLSWLGKCHLVHRLDQEQFPPQKPPSLRAPDLLAMFHYEGGTLPVLIEVKKTAKMKLKWSESYYNGLIEYAKILNLPLLVAVQWQEDGLWTLCDSRTFAKANTNYHLDAKAAFDNNLMCELAGDFLCGLRPHVGMHMTLKKLGPPIRDDDGSILSMDAEITDAHFTDADGNRLSSLRTGIFELFLATDQDVSLEETVAAVIQRFVITDRSPSVFAQHLLLQAHLGVKRFRAEGPIPWRRLLDRQRFTFSGRDLLAATALGMQNITRQSQALRPHTWPSFLGPE